VIEDEVYGQRGDEHGSSILEALGRGELVDAERKDFKKGGTWANLTRNSGPNLTSLGNNNSRQILYLISHL
jgi:hypothetical protein